MANPNCMWRAIIAQTAHDAYHWLKGCTDDDYTWNRHTRPSKLDAFISWRWMWDDKFAKDRQIIFEQAGMDPAKFEQIFKEWDLAEAKKLRKWARRVLWA